MKIFVTGATGFIGSAVVQELIGAGHQALGLARNDVSAEALAKMGAEVHRGDLSDLESLAAGAKASDGVAHLAFIHDFSNFMASVAADRQAIQTLADALAGTDKPFISTFGTLLMTPGRLLTENDSAPPQANPRADNESVVMEAAGRGIRASLMRLAPTVHGAGDGGFVPMLIGLARQKGYAAYIGDGENRWPAVHRLDAARLYRLALEKAAPGTRLHAIAEEGIPMRQIAVAIGEGLGVPVRSVTLDEAPEYYGWMAMFAGSDAPTSSAITRETMGWTPQEPDLLTDMKENGYFDAARASKY